MASKRRLRSKKCGTKVRYVSYAEADQARYPNRKILIAYGCNFCGRIHLGHPTKSAKQSMAALSRIRRAAA